MTRCIPCPRRLRPIAAAVLLLSAPAAFAAIGDFDGDGIGDLAIGVPEEDLVVNGTNRGDAGVVLVLYGSANGVASSTAGVPPSQTIHQDVGTLADAVEAGDRFGADTAAGDFDNDGFDDLAIVARGDNAVQVVYGSASGLRSDNSQFFTATQVDDANGQAWRVCGSNTEFACHLVSGDFDGNGSDDLAIEGHETHPTELFASKIAVLYGAIGNRLSLAGADMFLFANNQRAIPDGDIGGVSATLAAGDVDGDGADDLAVGLPFSNLNGTSGVPLLDAGRVGVLLGTSASGLSTAGFRTLLQSTGSGEAPEFGNAYGSALAMGDFDGDGLDDLAVGTPRDDRGVVNDEGNVRVYRSASTFHSLWTQSVFGLPRDSGDHVGGALAAADFDGDGRDDLAIGVPGDFPNATAGDEAGAVIVVHGGASGLAAANGPGMRYLTQSNTAGQAEAVDRFATRLEAGQVGRSAHADLVAGVPGEDVALLVPSTPSGCTAVSCITFTQVNVADAGVVNISYGSATGLGATNAQSLSQSSANVPDSAESGDRFGN